MTHLSPQARTRQALAAAIAFYGATTLVSMAAMSIGAAVVLAAMAWRIAAARDEPLRLPAGGRSLAWAGLALGAAGVASLVAQSAWPLSYGGRSAQVLWVRALAKLLYLFWPLALALGIRELDERGRERALRFWLGAFGLLSAVACLQFFTGWPRPQPIPTAPERFHATLFLGHHLSVASIWIFPFFFALDRARRTREPSYAAASLLGAATVFLTYSRMAWVALPAALLAYVLWSLKRRQRLIACLAAGAVGVALLLSPQVQSRLGWGTGWWTRQELWRANWAFFTARPLTGAGLLSNQELSGYYLMESRHTTEVFSGHAHNNALDILGGLGALGLAAWIFWWFRVGQAFWRSPSRVAWVCALIAYHLNGLTQVNFWEGKVFHSLSWAVAWALAADPKGGSKGRVPGA